MKVQDIHEYFTSKNRRHLTLEEVAALTAYLMVTAESAISANDIMAEAQKNGYYNISWTVLYRALRFFESHDLCVLGKRYKRIGEDKKAGRPEKTYSLPKTHKSRVIVLSISNYWTSMPGNKSTFFNEDGEEELEGFVCCHKASTRDEAIVYVVSR